MAIAPLVASAVLGAALGVVNVLALRRAVARLVCHAQPPRAIALGAVARNFLTLAPVFLLAGGGVALLSTGLLAFLVARVVTVRRLATRLRGPERGEAR